MEGIIMTHILLNVICNINGLTILLPLDTLNTKFLW